MEAFYTPGRILFELHFRYVVETRGQWINDDSAQKAWWGLSEYGVGGRCYWEEMARVAREI